MPLGLPFFSETDFFSLSLLSTPPPPLTHAADTFTRATPSLCRAVIRFYVARRRPPPRRPAPRWPHPARVPQAPIPTFGPPRTAHLPSVFMADTRFIAVGTEIRCLLHALGRRGCRPRTRRPSRPGRPGCAAAFAFSLMPHCRPGNRSPPSRSLRATTSDLSLKPRNSWHMACSYMVLGGDRTLLRGATDRLRPR